MLQLFLKLLFFRGIGLEMEHSCYYFTMFSLHSFNQGDAHVHSQKKVAYEEPFRVLQQNTYMEPLRVLQRTPKGT